MIKSPRLSLCRLRKRVLAAALLLPLCLWGRATLERFDKDQNKIFEFLADHMDAQDKILLGKGNVTLINLDYYVTAQYAKYDTQNGYIDLEGEVNVFKGNALYLKSQTVRIELNSDYAFLEPFYLQDSSTGMWISSSQADFSNEEYRFGESVLSTCNASNPIWHIEMNEGTYDAQSEWMSMWGPKLYFYRYPVFYSPYLSFSAGYKRKTGLLYPSFSHSKDDGFVYNQPIFIAPEDSWDVTLSPQIRTTRGKGLFGEFRMADEQNNILWFNTGFFRNTQSYQDEYDLKNRTHLGYQLKYQHQSLLNTYFSHFDEDGIYVDFTHLNDIDYLRLQKEGEESADIRNKLLTSRLNYYLKGEQDYLGFYAKYYIDLSKADNDTTLQTLPAIQYHRHTEPIFLDRLTYSADYHVKNLARRTGYEVTQQELSVPVSYTMPLADDYFSLTLGSSFYATRANYRGFNRSSESLLENGSFYSNYYTAAINSDLARFYEDFFHTIHYEAAYILPGMKDRRGDFAEVLSLPGNSEELDLKMSQFFYDSNSRMFLYHKIAQPLYFDDYLEKYGELENEVRYYFDEHWSLGSTIFYSHEENRIAESSHDLTYTEDYFSAYLGHFFRERYLRNSEGGSGILEANFIRAGFKKDFEEFSLFGSLGYDYQEKYFRTWSAGIQKEVKCFSYRLRFANEIRPVLTTTGAKPVEDRYVMFEFRFVPVISAKIKQEQ